ncbi:conserved hypothetical protein [Neisseria gonorrhoeae]|nr:conserved hypothetical protein [Neisseria gonorrhoeae]SCW10212.1 conserved hypothetical protein [Neisseria gonorrhoeae]SCW10366.1 conserved hypothetical protein [Neisseria gonorrhoeae]SCW11714.1 conserved hypothetical protein [Neisseria gonorrhoeae]
MSERVGGKTCQRDASDKGVELGQRAQARPTAVVEQNGKDVGKQKGGEHHPKDNPPRQVRTENADGQVGGEEDEGKGKRAPSGVDAENPEGELHQIVAGGDDEDMEKHQPEECLLLLCGGQCVHKNLSERRSDGIPYRRNAV